MRTLVINLDRCPDRLATVMEELQRCGLSGERLPAVDGRLLDTDQSGNIPNYKRRGTASETYYRGSAGCYFSHLRALEVAIAGDIWPTLIVEDDIQYNGDTGTIQLPVTDKPIIYLGGMDDHRRNRVYGAHAIAYTSKSAAEAVLQFMRTHPNTADSILIRFNQLTNLIHYARPWQFIQLSGISTITGTFMNRVRMTRNVLVTF